MLFYILDEQGHPKNVTAGDWATWFQHNPTVLETTYIGRIRVQTIFKSYVMGDIALANPPLWETRVKGGPLHDEQRSYPGSREEALRKHAEMVKHVKHVVAGHRTN